MNQLIRRSLLLLAVVIVAAPLLTRGTQARTSCFVTIGTGDVQGLDTGASCSFLGIPYAAPPVNALRWKPPQPPGPLPTTPFNATALGPTCTASESCLALNIWAPNPLPVTPAPVIVWLHTGGFVATSGGFAPHNPRRFAEETGVIVVAPNYRLGALGFLAHPALALEDPLHAVSGNYGLMDQRFALQFVRDNIASFGGDPNNVTIAGTSAGAHSVGMHLVSPASAGLFHRAIIQSGTPTIRWPTESESYAQGNALATALTCPLDPSTVLACLRGKPAAQVLNALTLGPEAVLEPLPNRAVWNPVVDGIEIPDQPRLLFESGQFHQVPTMIGFMRDESAGPFITRSFLSGVTLAQYDAWLTSEFGPDAPAVQAAYPAANFPLPFDAMAQVVGDGHFVCGGRRLARSLSDYHTPVYFYSYDYIIDDVFPDRAIHGLEGNILFGNNYVLPQFPNHPLNAADQALHAQMAGYWARFAATGNPNIDDDTVVHWQTFRDPQGLGRGASRYIVFDEKIRTDKRLRESSCDFWEPYFLRSMLGKVPAWQ